MASLPHCTTLLTELEAETGILHLTLNRPQKRNAMNEVMVSEIINLFSAIASQPAIRAVVIRGAEGNFCAGGDISTMHNATDSDGNKLPAEQAAWVFNRNFGRMISQVQSAPQTVIAVLEGASLGGGFGLACVSDVAIASADAMFAMPETGLGIIPAQIAPFVVKRIGLTQARCLALLGERVSGEQAYRLGLVHYVAADAEELESRLNKTLKLVSRCGPVANAKTKELMLMVGTLPEEELLDKAADMFAVAINSDEGKEGTHAFLEKRKPSWAADQ